MSWLLKSYRRTRNNNGYYWDFLVVQYKSNLQMQRTQVRSLVRVLRSHMPWSRLSPCTTTIKPSCCNCWSLRATRKDTIPYDAMKISRVATKSQGSQTILLLPLNFMAKPLQLVKQMSEAPICLKMLRWFAILVMNCRWLLLAMTCYGSFVAKSDLPSVGVGSEVGDRWALWLTTGVCQVKWN